MRNQDGGEIWHIRLGFETASWQHAAHTLLIKILLDSCRVFLENAKTSKQKKGSASRVPMRELLERFGFTFTGRLKFIASVGKQRTKLVQC